jgi:DNA-directed RNA polymerase subunit RPC12/RpoP
MSELKPAEIAETRPEPQVKACPVDLSIQCPTCGTQMQAEHAHYRCLRCGYRDSCCM